MRKKPYKTKKLHKVPCIKCGAPSTQQWQICSDGNQYRGLCTEHDIELNELVMRWAFGGTKEKELNDYRNRLRRNDR